MSQYSKQPSVNDLVLFFGLHFYLHPLYLLYILRITPHRTSNITFMVLNNTHLTLFLFRILNIISSLVFCQLLLVYKLWFPLSISIYYDFENHFNFFQTFCTMKHAIMKVEPHLYFIFFKLSFS